MVAFWGNNVGLFGLGINYLNVIILSKYSSSIYSDNSNLISFEGMENCRVLSPFAQTQLEQMLKRFVHVHFGYRDYTRLD